jgi:hypothetical protein
MKKFCVYLVSVFLLTLAAVLPAGNAAAESGTIEGMPDYGHRLNFSVSGAATITESTNDGWKTKHFIKGTVQSGAEVTIAISGNGTTFSSWHWVNEDKEATMGIRFEGTDINKTITLPPGKSGSLSASYTVPNGARSVKAYASVGNAWINPYGGGSSMLTLECYFNVVAPDPGNQPLQIELSVADGQRFTQGDDLDVGALVTRGTRESVAGADVTLKLISPKGTVFAQKKMTTDSNGLADWRSFFTADATPGDWQVMAEASSGGESARITRTIELARLNVTAKEVEANIKKIIQEWLSNGQPDGISESFINSLWWPKGFKVNLREHMDKRYAPYTCSSQALKTLLFLNNIRFSVQKERRLWMAGVDYGPISDGTSLIHVAVGIYPNGSNWLSGYVLEPWFNQKKESWNARAWSAAFGASPRLDWLVGNPWKGEYPTTGSDGGYYPKLTASIPTSLQGRNRTRVLTYSPVFVIVTDAQGRRVGRLKDGSVVNEIPGSEQSHANNDDGTFINMISVPNGQYQVSITGTDNGAFHLVSGTDTAIVNYSKQPIQEGKQATFTLKSTDLNQPLVLADGRAVTPRSGFPEGDKEENGLIAVGDHTIQLQSKLTVKKVGKYSSITHGQLVLQNNGAFNMEDNSTPHSIGGAFTIDGKGKSILLMPSAAGLAALESKLIDYLEQAGTNGGVYLYDLDFEFQKIGISKLKIDKKTGRAAGKIKLNVSGTVSGCMPGDECWEARFTYKANIVLMD